MPFGTPVTVLTGRGGWLVGPDPDPTVATLAEHGELSVEVHGELTAVPAAPPGDPRPPWWAQFPADGQLSRVGFVSGRVHLRPGPTAVAPPSVDPAGLACSCYADHPEDDPRKRCSHVTAATAILAGGYRPRPPAARVWNHQITDPAVGQSAPAATASVEQLTSPPSAPDNDQEKLTAWLAANVAHAERRPERVREELLARFRREQIEPPTPGRLLRMVRSALRTAEQSWALRISERLDPPTTVRLLNLITADEADDGGTEDETQGPDTVLGLIESSAGRVPAQVGRATSSAAAARTRGTNLLASATPWIGLMLQPRKVS